MIITKTPLRLSLLGGNTDFPEYYLRNEGLVLTSTIDKYIYCIVKKRFDNEIWINYSIKEKVKNVLDIKHDLVREAMILVGISPGIEITFLADIPSEGSGLGSSSALLVGVLNVLHNYIGEPVSAKQLAKEACAIEIQELGKHIGIQDQYAVALGGLREFSFLKSGNVHTSQIKLDTESLMDFQNSLMLFYTGITRKSDDILNDFIINDNLLDQIKVLTFNGIEALENANYPQFADQLNQYWALKQSGNSKIMTEEIKTMINLAIMGGAAAVKIVGAGGGGFLLVMCEPMYRIAIKDQLKNYQEMPFQFSDEGSKVIFNV